MEKANLKKKIGNLPQAPGVYVFLSVAKSAPGGRVSNKEILYIGKATNLRSRVSSYFRGVIPSEVEESWTKSSRRFALQDDIKNYVRPIERMIHQVSDLEFFETDSVLEALILESNLIKKHQPKYNVDLKDDKSFSYFVVTKEEFPKVLIFRKTDIDFKKLQTTHYKLQTIFGPYTSKKQMEIALKIIRKIFPFHAYKQKTEKGCLDFQLGRCPGPYAGAISKKDYAKNIKGIQMILEGKKKSLVRNLEKEMKSAAKKEEFEKAAELRNKIYALNHIKDVALMNRDFDSESIVKGQLSNVLRIEAFDISNISGQSAVGSMVVFEGKNPNRSQYRKFKIKFVKGIDDVGMMREVLARRFSNDWVRPDLVLLDGGQGHVNAIAELFEVLKFEVPVVGVAKGKTRKNLNFQFPISNQILMSKFSKEIHKILEDKNLIKHIMDEAHRFAISFHRKRRGEDFLK